MGRRLFIALGSGRYCNLPEEDQLPVVATDIVAMTELLEEFGYRRVLAGLGEYDGAEQIRRKLSHWSRDCELTADDVVVLYFAGHGVVEDRGRHYLLCWDSRDLTARETGEAVGSGLGGGADGLSEASGHR
ncbi:caspase family protein [Streptomyces sp. Ac-502]|uniref:caspase family protein n=1 Tax=Streptomyces sp. Ac-502 TaxID=3342801 RepID=UPI0038626218